MTSNDQRIFSQTAAREALLTSTLLLIGVPILVATGIIWSDWSTQAAVVVAALTVFVSAFLIAIVTKGRDRFVRQDEMPRPWWWIVGAMLRNGLAFYGAFSILYLLFL